MGQSVFYYLAYRVYHAHISFFYVLLNIQVN